MVKLQHMGLLAIAISSILALSVTLPAATALTQRDNFDDNHTTARFLGGQKVCGDKLCTGSQYSKHIEKIMAAQQTSVAQCREAMAQGKKC